MMLTGVFDSFKESLRINSFKSHFFVYITCDFLCWHFPIKPQYCAAKYIIENKKENSHLTQKMQIAASHIIT